MSDDRQGAGPSPDLELRVATLGERAALEALQRRASLNNPGDRAAILAHPEAIELPADQIAAGLVFVASAEGTLVGFAALLMPDPTYADLDGLFVEPTHWRQGIGRALVEYCVEALRAKAIPSLHVVGNPHAEAFYRACHFERVGTVATRFGPGLTFRRTV